MPYEGDEATNSADYGECSPVVIDTAAWLVLIPIVIVGLAVWRIRP